MKAIQIFILSRDRVFLIVESIRAALAQRVEGYAVEVIVSDNSETDAVEEMMRGSFPHIKYIRRRPSLRVWDHFRAVIHDASSDYVVIFHDDDTMVPNYCQNIMIAFEKNPKASAIACNAMRIDTNGKELGYINTHGYDKVITDEMCFLKNYILTNKAEEGIAPFPSYCYKLSSLALENVNERDGGVCADATFLSKTTKAGPIVWLPQALIRYRVHAQSGSASIPIDDYRKLWRYMISVGLDKRDKDFADWRYHVWFTWYIRENSWPRWYDPTIRPSSWRDRVVHKAYLKHYLARPGRTYFRILLGYLIDILMQTKGRLLIGG